MHHDDLQRIQEQQSTSLGEVLKTLVSGVRQVERAIKLQESAPTVADQERVSLDNLANILDPTVLSDDVAPSVLADSARIPAVLDEPTQHRSPYPCKFCSKGLSGPPSRSRHEKTCKKRPSSQADVDELAASMGLPTTEAVPEAAWHFVRRLGRLGH